MKLHIDNAARETNAFHVGFQFLPGRCAGIHARIGRRYLAAWILSERQPDYLHVGTCDGKSVFERDGSLYEMVGAHWVPGMMIKKTEADAMISGGSARSLNA